MPFFTESVLVGRVPLNRPHKKSGTLILTFVLEEGTPKGQPQFGCGSKLQSLGKPLVLGFSPLLLFLFLVLLVFLLLFLLVFLLVLLVGVAQSCRARALVGSISHSGTLSSHLDSLVWGKLCCRKHLDALTFANQSLPIFEKDIGKGQKQQRQDQSSKRSVFCPGNTLLISRWRFVGVLVLVWLCFGCGWLLVLVVSRCPFGMTFGQLCSGCAAARLPVAMCDVVYRLRSPRRFALGLVRISFGTAKVCSFKPLLKAVCAVTDCRLNERVACCIPL